MFQKICCKRPCPSMRNMSPYSQDTGESCMYICKLELWNNFELQGQKGRNCNKVHKKSTRGSPFDKGSQNKNKNNRLSLQQKMSLIFRLVSHKCSIVWAYECYNMIQLSYKYTPKPLDFLGMAFWTNFLPDVRVRPVFWKLPTIGLKTHEQKHFW